MTSRPAPGFLAALALVFMPAVAPAAGAADAGGLPQPPRFVVNVTFGIDRADIKPGGEGDLPRLRQILLENPAAHLTLEGHTDSTGLAPRLNQALSQRRADACRDYILRDGGIDPARVTAVGYGQKHPVASNQTYAGRKKNRRIVAEFTLASPAPAPASGSPAQSPAVRPPPAAAPAAVAPAAPAVVAPEEAAPPARGFLAPAAGMLPEKSRFIVRVTFGVNRADIEPGSEADLAALRKVLLKYPEGRVTFEGHTDSSGLAPRLNKALSQQRAEACRDFVLRGGGLAADRVKAVGYGQEHPIASNKTVAGRKENRRIVAEVTFDSPVEPAEGDPFESFLPETKQR